MKKKLTPEFEQHIIETIESEPSEIECLEGLARMNLLSEEGIKKLAELRGD